jgi:hypothetical protein
MTSIDGAAEVAAIDRPATPAPMGGLAWLTLTLTCLTAGLCFAGAVTGRALLIFVEPAILLGLVVSAGLTARRAPRSAIGLGVLVAIGWSEVVNVASGQGFGPAARSSFVAGGCAVLAAAAVGGRWPSLFLVPVGGIVLGALSLGAGAEVRAEALATCVLAVLCLAVVEADRRRWATRPRRPWAVVVITLLVAAASAGVLLTQARHDSHPTARGFTASEDASITPPWADPFPAELHSKSRQPTAPTPPRRHHHRQHHHQRRHPNPTVAATPPPPQSPHHSSHRTAVLVLAAVGALLFALVLAIGSRVTRSWWAWRRLRRRLRRQPSAEAVAGAWVWARLRLAACRMWLPARLSPEQVVWSDEFDDLPPPAAEALRSLGRLTTPLLFAALDPNDNDVRTSWQLADDVGQAAKAALSRRGRAGLRLRLPPRDRDLHAARSGRSESAIGGRTGG